MKPYERELQELMDTVPSQPLGELNKGKVIESLPRRPISDDEFETVVQFIKTWRSKGHQVAIGPVREMTTHERHAVVTEMRGEGIIQLTDLKHDCELIIVKVDDGRNVFGFRRYRYNSYVSSSSDDTCLANGSSKNLAWSISKLGNVLRS